MSPADNRKVEEHALLPIGRPSTDGSVHSLSDDEDDDWEIIGKSKKEEKQTLFGAPVWALFLMLVFAIITFLVAFTWRPKEKIPSMDGNHNAKNEYILWAYWDLEAVPQERHYHWTISDKIINPDGVYRPMILINEQFPGPLIECNEGDTLIIHVDNQATNATSFHWHGLYQNGTNWMDGTVGITQCPIAPGSQFVYNFAVSGQSGTYWYHAHQSVQASDGLFGPLIIHSKDERKQRTLEYATDRIVMVHDHYYDLTSELLMTYLQPGRENAEPVPDSALINGKNVRNCEALPSRKCDSSSVNLETFKLERNQNHRFRFINVGAFAEMQIQIDEHDFAVTEVDGTDVVGDVRYHRLNILPAQRYSIVLTTNVTTSQSFWLRARMVTTCFAEENPEMEPEVRAIIQYTDALNPSPPTISPTSKDWSEVVELECRDLNTSALVPIVPIRAPTKVDDIIELRSNFEIGDWRLSRGFINQTSYRPNVKEPSLHRIFAGIQAKNTSFDISATEPTGFTNSKAFDIKRELVYQTTGITTLDIVVSNFDDGAHPFHLHGYKFWVLASGSGYFDHALYDTIDLANPLRRDTATVEAFGWVLLRFVADNPGIWPFHCHVAWHSEAGLLMQFWTRSDAMREWVLPEKLTGLCQLEGLEKGKGPDDEIWFGNTG